MTLEPRQSSQLPIVLLAARAPPTVIRVLVTFRRLYYSSCLPSCDPYCCTVVQIVRADTCRRLSFLFMLLHPFASIRLFLVCDLLSDFRTFASPVSSVANVDLIHISLRTAATWSCKTSMDAQRSCACCYQQVRTKTCCESCCNNVWASYAEAMTCRDRRSDVLKLATSVCPSVLSILCERHLCVTA